MSHDTPEDHHGPAPDQTLNYGGYSGEVPIPPLGGAVPPGVTSKEEDDAYALGMAELVYKPGQAAFDRNVDRDVLLQLCRRMPEEEADSFLIETCSEAVAKRLQVQADKGYYGWLTEGCSADDLKDRLLKNLSKNDFIDVMALAGMLYIRDQLGLD